MENFMYHPDKRPRHYAIDLTNAWVIGRPTKTITDSIPIQWRDLCNTQARAFCEQITFHRRNKTDLQTIKGSQMREWIEIYSNRMAVK